MLPFYCAQYRGRCIGRVAYFISCYCGVGIAEMAQIGDKVQLHGKDFATFKWCEFFGQYDVPEFIFLNDPEARYTQAQAKLRNKAVAHALQFDDSPTEIQKIDKRVIRTLNKRVWQHATLWGGICGSSRCDFFLGKSYRGGNYSADHLYFQTDKNRYVFDTSLNEWLGYRFEEME